VPLEVQIRTVFEDAWNELDHPLRYKGIRRETLEMNQTWQTLRDNIVKQLGLLKSQLENCGKNADIIREQYYVVAEVIERQQGRPTSPILPTTNFDLHENFNISNRSVLSVKGDITTRFDALDTRIKNLVSTTYQEASGDVDKYNRLSNELRDDIAKLRDEYKDSHPRKHKQDDDFDFFSHMQEGVVRTWRVRFSKFLNEKETIQFLSEWNDAIKMFLMLEEDSRFENSAFLRLRVGTCIWVRDDYERYALYELREAARLVDSDARIKRSGIVAASIFHVLGYVLWRERLALEQEGQLLGYSTVAQKKEEQVVLLKEAISATQEAVVRLKEAEGDARSLRREVGTSLNNLVAMYWEVKELVPARYCEVVDIDDMRKHVEEFVKLTTESLSEVEGSKLSAARCDSLVRAYLLLGNRSMVVKYDKILKAKLEEEETLRMYVMDEIEAMRYTRKRAREVKEERRR